PAIEVRHDDVKDDGGGPQFLGTLEALQAARRSNYCKTCSLEFFRNELARCDVVVDDKDAVGNGNAAILDRRHRGIATVRKADGEQRPLPHPARPLTVAAHQAGEFSRNRQAKTGSAVTPGG